MKMFSALIAIVIDLYLSLLNLEKVSFRLNMLDENAGIFDSTNWRFLSNFYIRGSFETNVSGRLTRLWLVEAMKKVYFIKTVAFTFYLLWFLLHIMLQLINMLAWLSIRKIIFRSRTNISFPHYRWATLARTHCEKTLLTDKAFLWEWLVFSLVSIS